LRDHLADIAGAKPIELDLRMMGPHRAWLFNSGPPARRKKHTPAGYSNHSELVSRRPRGGNARSVARGSRCLGLDRCRRH
jgi:hypothetical protein